MEGGRSDVLWDVMQENTRPSYGFMLQPTAAHPDGMTTMPERWTLGDSQNHVILLQIEEWFHTGVAGIKQAPNSVAYRELIYQADPGRRPHARQGPLHDPAGHGAQRVAPRRDRHHAVRRHRPRQHQGDGLRPRQERGADVRGHRQRRRPLPALRGRLPGLRRRRRRRDVPAGHEHRAAVGGTVPATLSLSLGTPAVVRRVHARRRPQLRREHDAPTSSRRPATRRCRSPTRRRTRPAAWSTARSRSSEPLQARANTGAFAPLQHDRGRTAPLLTYTGPVSNDAVNARLPAAHRRQPGAAHRQLQQDADVHVVDHDTVSDRTAAAAIHRRGRPRTNCARHLGLHQPRARTRRAARRVRRRGVRPLAPAARRG